MCHVPRSNECEGPHGKRIAAGNAATHPRLRRKTQKQIQSGTADIPKFFHVTAPGTRVGMRSGYTGIAVEAGQRIFQPTGEAHGAKHEGALGIVDMTENLSPAPLPRGITRERLFFRDTFQKGRRRDELLIEGPADVGSYDLIDVSEKVFRRFRAIRHRHHCHVHLRSPSLPAAIGPERLKFLLSKPCWRYDQPTKT